MTINRYRMADTADLIEAGLASGDDLARALAERLDDMDEALGMAEHVAEETALLRRALDDVETELAAYHAAELRSYDA